MRNLVKARIRIGISSCLLGEKVRYNGAHKKDVLITGSLSRVFQWVGVCPEVEAGFGLPREPMQLERIAGETRLMTVNTRRDLTRPLLNTATKSVRKLKALRISGYILKKNSPSCGLLGVSEFRNGRELRTKSRGLFARALRKALPSLPVIEEERLHVKRYRKKWLRRVFAYYQRHHSPRHRSLSPKTKRTEV